MSEMPAYKRSVILSNTSRIIESKKIEIAELITRESGKAISPTAHREAETAKAHRG